MKNLDYAYCVARLRANESYMLDRAFILKLCESENADAAYSSLIEKGWIEEKSSVRDIVSGKGRELWTLLNECVPDKSELDIFCVLNDFFNIKTAIKCLFSGIDPTDYYLFPTSVNLDELTEKAKVRDLSSLSCRGADTAEKAYNLALLTENGQSAEIIIDRGTVNCLCEYAEEKNSSIANEICGFLCDAANIKTALRINALGKSKDFAQEAIGNCFKLDRNHLIALSLGEKDALYDYLMSTEYAQGISCYISSSAEFEKWCDDKVIEMIGGAKYTAFGFDPVCAFYYGKQSEIKNISIILTALQSGLSAEKIKERVRLNYV